MIVFDNNTKKLEIPVGLGNLDVTVQENVNVDPVTVAEIYSAISASTAETIVVAQEYTDAAIDAQEFKTINGSAITGSGNLVIEGGSGKKSYILNQLSQQEVASLYTELSVYQGNNSRVSSGFPAQDYEFIYYYNESQDKGGGFIPLNISMVDSQKVTFLGDAAGYASRGFKSIYYSIYANGTTAYSVNDCCVLSLNGQKGALSAKTINGISILGSGDIEIQGGGGDYVVVDALSAITSPVEGMIAYVKSSTTTYSGWEIINDQTEGYVARIWDSAQTRELAWVYRSGDNYFWDWAENDNNDGKWHPWVKDEAKAYFRNNTGNTYFDIVFEDPSLVYIELFEDYTKTAITKSVDVEGQNYEYDGSEWVNKNIGKKVYMLDNLTKSELASLYSEILAACNGGKPSEFPANEYEFYSKIDVVSQMQFIWYDYYGNFILFGGVAADMNGEAVRIKTIKVYSDGGFESNIDGFGSQRPTYMLTLHDLTGGTPEWRFFPGTDDLKNLKDRSNCKTAINIYLFYDLANEDKPYAVADAWRYDGENGNSDFYFYFDDIEVSTGTRYRGVYKWGENNNEWTTIYWGEYKGYDASTAYTDSAITQAISSFSSTVVNNSKDVANLWSGTRAQYAALTSTTNNTIYFITD